MTKPNKSARHAPSFDTAPDMSTSKKDIPLISSDKSTNSHINGKLPPRPLV